MLEKRALHNRRINQSIVCCLGCGRVCRRQKTVRTFGDFDSFDRLIVHGAGTLFDESIAFNTKIEDVCALHGYFDEPFYRDVDDVSCNLPSRRHGDKKGWMDEPRINFSNLVFGDISLSS